MKVARRGFKVEVPSVAMGDIAFNLLVFFVILAKASDDSHLKWTPAAAKKVEAGNKARVGVVVDNNNKLYVNGRETSEQQLTDQVKTFLGDAGAGDRKVLLKIHKDSQAIRYEKVLESVGLAGGEIVHVLNESK
jgi:biopolymer transport protein ExbD